MHYNSHYEHLIARARNRMEPQIYEQHHIVPRCLGGPDDSDNLVKLTPEEHYVAHQLLVKMHPNNYRLLHAATMMHVGRSNNKLYGWLRRRLAKSQSIRQSGKDNNQFGTCFVSNIKARTCIRIQISDLGEYLNNGWIKRRIINWDNNLIYCRGCGVEFLRTGNENYHSPGCKKQHGRYITRSGKESSTWKGFWKTPTGIYETLKAAAVAENTTIETIRRRAKNANFSDYQRIMA